MTVIALRKMISQLEPNLPLTKEYEARLFNIDLWDYEKPWYRTQQEHWLGWLKEYNTSGYYNRKNGDRDAEYVFNHINCPPMLFWFIEAVGVKREILRKVIKTAIESKNSFPKQCKMLREIISWEDIESLI